MKSKLPTQFIVIGIACIFVSGILFALGMILPAVIALIIGIAVLLILWIYKKNDSGEEKLKYEYEKQDRVVSAPEAMFYEVLQDIIPRRKYRILQQVCLSAIINKKNASFRNELFRVIDYCVVTEGGYEPVLMIELNDKSHLRSERIQRDEKIRLIAQSAKLPVAYIDLTMASDVSYVRAEIKRHIRL